MFRSQRPQGKPEESEQTLLVMVQDSWVSPCWRLKHSTCVSSLEPLLSSRAEVQTQPLAWSLGPVQNLMGGSTQTGRPQPCHTEARDISGQEA